MGSIADVTQPTPALDFSTFDTDVRVQDDLFRHVNGKWIERHRDPGRQAAHRLVHGAARGGRGGGPRDHHRMDRSRPSRGTETRKIADLYASFMDERARSRPLGAQPLSALLARDRRRRLGRHELIELLGRLARAGVAGWSASTPSPTPAIPNRYVMFVGQGGIGLPDEEYYREDEYADDARRRTTRTSRGCSGSPSVEDPADPARRVFDLETDIAALPLGQGRRRRDMRQMYNLMHAGRVQRPRSADLHWRDVHGRGRDRRAAHGRAGGARSRLLRRGRRAAHRRTGCRPGRPGRSGR